MNYNSNADQDDGTCQFEDNNDSTQNNNSGEETCTGICDEDTEDSAKSDDSDPVFTLTIVMGIIFLVAVAIIVVSRERDGLNGNDEGDKSESFVPELPPLEPPKD